MQGVALAGGAARTHRSEFQSTPFSAEDPMADVTASMVKELRERTGAGMMDCKNALVEAAGDLAKAAEVIQKKGLAKAVKAAGKIAADGMIVANISADG